jgi:hypothetical protein
MRYQHALLGSTPSGPPRVRLEMALMRSLRTLLQGVAAAVPAASAGSAVLSISYWTAIGYSCLGAAITAGVSLLQNLANFLPDDPTQVQPAGAEARPAAGQLDEAMA